MGEYNNEGIVVAGGNGNGSQLNQLSRPDFIFVDEDESVYISEYYNHRVIVDDLGQIYVVDFGSHRVMRWCKEKKEGEIVVGKNRQGNQPNQLYFPRGLSFDDEENLYILDANNYRIQKFE
ncbi:unnamed protein product, partial [Adineta steineri]